MNESPVITRWLECHRRLSAEAEAFHDSQAVAFGILSEYDALSPEERKSLFPVLAEWLLSDDNRLRYDAAFVISQRNIREMMPAVQMALAHSASKTGPEARDEVEHLREIIDRLKAIPLIER